jgi:cytoskeleton protein RodZ
LDLHTLVRPPERPRVGETLRAARLGQTRSIEDVSALTRVSVRHLRAIEHSDYRVFAAPVFAVGFVKSYARAVGLNAQPLGDAFRAELREAAAG